MSHLSHATLVDPIGAVDHVLGADHAPVVVVEYGDFECPNCKQAAPAVEMLAQRFDGNVRFAFRHFPLEEVHPRARQAAEAAERCVLTIADARREGAVPHLGRDRSNA